MTERHAAALAEFAELCLVSARDLAARQAQAESAADAAALAGALHKVGRSLRQSLALEAKLRRDQEQGVRDAEARAAEVEDRRRQARRDQLQTAVKRLIWTEHDPIEEEGHDLVEALSELLDAEALTATFGDEPLAAHIAQVCEALGLPPPLARRDDDNRRRSSA